MPWADTNTQKLKVLSLSAALAAFLLPKWNSPPFLGGVCCFLLTTGNKLPRFWGGCVQLQKAAIAPALMAVRLQRFWLVTFFSFLDVGCGNAPFPHKPAPLFRC